MGSKFLKNILLFVMIVTWIGCGGLSSTESSSGGGDTTTGTGGSSGSSGAGGSGGSSSASSDFEVKGQLASLQVGGLQLEKNAISGTVTDVMAVNPQTGSASCKTASVDSNGSFKVNLTGKKPWFFYFFNRAKRGSSMFLGRFISSKMNTLVPASKTGSMDLGRVTINASEETATSEKSHSDILSGLGLDSSTAAAIEKLDPVARRYRNPDVDDDGQVDCSSSNSQYYLDFHVRFDMKINGSRAAVNNIIDNYLSDTATTVFYTGTGIYVAYPKTFSSATSGKVKFTDSSITTSEAGSVAAGTEISSITENAFGDNYSYGANTTNTSELPSGEIVFTFGSKTLTFSDVKTPLLSEITAPTGRIFPFVKFNKTSSTCTSSCTLSGISYKWLKKTDSGWTAATLSELSLITADKSGYLSFRVDGNSSKTVGFTIPSTSLDGTINWESGNASLSGVTEAQFKALTNDQVCHLGLSYDDQLGMRYFEGIQNSNGACSS